MLTIGDTARRAGVAPSTLRYYEEIGLLRPAARVGGQRRYDDVAVRRLEVIALCKAAGFELDQIRVLLTDDAPGRPASRALAEATLVQVQARIAELEAARELLRAGLACSCLSLEACVCGAAAAPAAADCSADDAAHEVLPELHR